MENGSSAGGFLNRDSNIVNMVRGLKVSTIKDSEGKLSTSPRSTILKTNSRPSTPNPNSRPGTPNSKPNELSKCATKNAANMTDEVKSTESEVSGKESVPIVPGRAKPKLVLHFDVRNTVLVADTVTNMNVAQAFNTFLTGVAWGKDVEGKWEWYSDIPSLTAPAPNVTTYYKHLEQRVVKTPSDRALLRQMTGDFTLEDIGKTFRPYFEKHIEFLKWPHGENGHPDLVMRGSDGAPYHYILPAYFKLIHQLQEEGRDFCVIIRTYGMDATQVLACTEQTLQGYHPQFPSVIPIDVNKIPGKVFRTKSGKIGFEKYAPLDNSGRTPRETITTERGIYRMLSDSTGVSGFVDDFLFWQDQGYHHTAAKPIWIDPRDRSVHHIIFDDNIRTWDVDSIVDLRMFDDAEHARIIDMKESVKFENAVLVPADLLESTKHEDYFIKKVELCEANYAQIQDEYS